MLQQHEASPLTSSPRAASAASMSIHASSSIRTGTTTPSPTKGPVLDESDATSMTTQSTTCTASRTPSPFTNDIHNHNCNHNHNAHHQPMIHNSRASSAESSPSTSGSSSRSHHDHDETGMSTPYSMLSALLSSTTNGSRGQAPVTVVSPDRVAVTPRGRPSGSNLYVQSRGSWSDSDDQQQQQQQREMIQREMLPTMSMQACKTPIRRGSPSWSIQQALFPDEETENLAPSSGKGGDDTAECLPPPPSRILGRAFFRSVSDSPAECTSNVSAARARRSWTSISSYTTSDGNNNVTSLESADDTPKHPIRTRRTRRSVAASNANVDPGFFRPEHRRRNSTGGKIHESPRPSSSLLMQENQSSFDSHHPPQSFHGDLNSNMNEPQAPPSHSKSKRWKQKRNHHHHRNHPASKMGLDLPGLSISSLEDRLQSAQASIGMNMNGSNHHHVSTSTDSPRVSYTSSSIASMSPRTWRTLLCRVRLTTLVWGLAMIGLTSLIRAAMFASNTFDFGVVQQQRPHPPNLKLVPPTGGLRGTLLLATVGRQPSRSHSHDDPKERASSPSSSSVFTKDKKKPKKKDDKKKKTTEKEKQRNQKTKPKATNEKATPQQSHAVPSTTTKKVKKTVSTVVKTARASSVARPPPLEASDYKIANARQYDDHDLSMFRAQDSSTGRTTASRVVMLHDDFQSPQMPTTTTAEEPLSRLVEQYPAEFTDNTQFYGRLDSSDERLRKMELREPYEQGECVPMEDWQTTFHPSCNSVHELGVEYLGEETTETDVQLFGTKGYWRYAWRLDLRKQKKGRNHKDAEQAYGDKVVLKTLKFRHDFEDAHFEHDRIDVVAMERLTSSPHVINAFGFCGHSVLTEYANGPRLGELADKSKSRPLARLQIARDIANGLADVHGIDEKNGNNATFVHLDINPANVVSIGGTLKLNDFNIGIIRRWNTTSQKPCGFPAQYPNPQWRSPEEARNEQNLTEKVDIFSMGHIFFRLICGHEPWNKLEPGGRPSKDVVNTKVQQGKLPFIPDSVTNTNDPEVAAIRDAMLDCYKADPSDRPKAREIAKKLDSVLETLSTSTEAPSAEELNL